MKNLQLIISEYLLKKDEWIFIGLILSFSLAYTQSNQWSEYLGFIGIYCLELLPILLFKFFQPRFNQVINKKLFAVLWVIIFIGYPLGIIAIDLSSPKNHYFLSSQGEILLVFFIVELILLFNQKIKKSETIRLSFNKLGLDRIILLILLCLASYLSLLATSDLTLWKEKNAMGHPIQFAVVLQNFPVFLSLIIQFFCLFFAGFIFYWINRYILIKQILTQRGTLIYLLSVICSVALLYPILTELYLLLPINRMGQPIIPAETANAFDWINARVATAIMLVSLPVILFVQWNQKNNQFMILKKQKVENELELLKQQINPHFFFNTLNNLYALCLKKSEQAPEVVLQLSELMRYVVYQAKQDFLPIKEEVKYIEDYIKLQSIRLRQSLNLNVNIELDDEQLLIAPLLLIILIENAFKHGIEPTTSPSYLKLDIKLVENKLTFYCENSIDADNQSPSIQQSGSQGIGLENLHRRLALLYPKQHQLILDKQSDYYSAKLIIYFRADI